jgi:hypothetical protein
MIIFFIPTLKAVLASAISAASSHDGSTISHHKGSAPVSKMCS